MTLRSGIALAVERAVQRRGSWDIEVGRGYQRWAFVTAAVDGSLQVVVPRKWVGRRRLLRSVRVLDAAAMRSLGFQEDEDRWLKPIRAYAGATREATEALERVFVEQFDATLDDDATVDEDYPGVVAGRPVPPHDARGGRRHDP